MRASGISLDDIIKAVAKSSLTLIVVVLIIGEVVAPLAQRSAIKRKTIAMSSGQALFTGQSVWIRRGNDYLQISNVATNNKELQGVIRYEFDPANKLKTASYAVSGSYQNGKWIFKDVSQTIFLADKTTSVFLPQQEWKINLNPRLNGLIHIDPDQKSLPQLYSYIKYRTQSGLNVDSYKFIFWQRILAPLATLIMILFAIPFVFGPFRSVTMGLRMLVGIMLGFGFHTLNQFFGSMSMVYHLPPVLAAILPLLIFMFIGRFILFVVR